MLYDVHAHIDLYEDRENVISYIENNNIYTLAMTNLPGIYEKYQNNYLPFKFIRFALGFHPELAHQYYSQIEYFLKLLPNAKYIGEIGLDFSRTKTLQDKNVQLRIFNEIIKHCKSFSDNKILNIHSRNAASEAIDIISGYHGKVILHWFSGKFSDVNNGISAGCFFSVNNQMIDTRRGRELIEQVPVEKLLIETDAPFSKMTSSKYCIESINYVYKQLSLIKKTNYDVLQKQLSENFYSLIDVCNNIHKD